MRLLNLKLDVRSELGKGSAFSLVLPPGNAPVISADPESAAGACREMQTQQPCILLVEDDQSVRDATLRDKGASS